MRRVAPFIPLFAVTLFTGCGDPPPLPMAGTPESTREVLVTALDGWKAGKSRTDLLEGSPPITMMDDDLNAGLKLTDYTIEGEPRTFGTAYSYVVTLSLRDTDGKSRTRRVSYSAVATPNRTVAREDRSP